jgi:hypothetical protein
MADMPEGMWRKVGGSYILVDSFGRSFQYIKADKNVMSKSKDTETNASLGAKWIKD